MHTPAELIFGESRNANHSPPASMLTRAAKIVCLLLIPAALPAQIPPMPPPPLQVPSGSDVCAVGKTCAELAPGMIRSAEGPSPLEENVRTLESSLGARSSGSPAGARAITCAVEAFRRAGVDEVHTERFSSTPGLSKPDSKGHRASGPVESENVVAEIRGREKPNDFVLLGAHIDSSGAGAGAVGVADNATLVIDAARVIHSSGSIPRRSIRFVLFAGSAQGMLGSWAFAQAHRAEMDKMAAAIIFGAGDSPVAGYSLGGRKDALVAVRAALDPLRMLDVEEFTLDARMDSDSFDFLLEGVPTLTATTGPAHSVVPDHSHSEALDAKTIGSLKRNVAIAAVTAYALADAEERVGPRLSRAEIGQSLVDTGLDQKMKLAGLWSLWESGDRGHRP